VLPIHTDDPVAISTAQLHAFHGHESFATKLKKKLKDWHMQNGITAH